MDSEYLFPALDARAALSCSFTDFGLFSWDLCAEETLRSCLDGDVPKSVLWYRAREIFQFNISKELTNCQLGLATPTIDCKGEAISTVIVVDYPVVSTITPYELTSLAIQ